MARSYIRFRATTDREQRLAQAQDALGISEDAATFDAATAHLARSVQAYEEVAPTLTVEQARALSTGVVNCQMEPTVSTNPNVQ